MRLLLFLTFIFFTSILFSQKVIVSEDFSLRNDVAYEIIGKLKGQYLLYRDKSTEYQIQAFDENLHQSWEKEIELDKKRPEALGIVPDIDGFSIIYNYKQRSSTFLKIHKYDPAANLQDSLTIKDFGTQLYTPDMELIYSEDRTKALVYYTEQQNKMTALVFDVNDLEILWENEFTFQDINFNRDFSQILVDNQGDLFVVFDKDNIKSKQEEHRFNIHHYEGKSQRTSFYNIPMKNYLTYDVFFNYDNLNQRLVAGGLYSAKNRGRTEGLFYLNIAPTDIDNHLLVFHPFEDEFISTVMGKKSKDKKGIFDCDIQEIVLRRDGGILLIGERNKIYERRMTSNSRGYTDRNGNPFIVDYYYDDLFVVSIHPDGKVHWKNVLHKKQYSQDDDAIYSSYFLLKTPKNLRLIFNDEISYENTVSEYVINGSGNLNRNSVLSTEDQELRLRFRDALQTSSNEIIVPSERRNRLKLVKVSY